MIVYLSLLVTAFLAIIGTIGKTTSKTEGKHFHSLTTFGVVVLILTILSLCFNLWMQNDADKEKKKEREFALTKAKQDSLIAANRFLIDSLGHQETIADLQFQRRFDSQQIVRDSAHFNTTLKRFSEQLTAQEKILTNVSRLLHPLFPLTISFRFKILGSDIDSPKWKNTLSRFNDAHTQLMAGNKEAFPDDMYFIRKPQSRDYNSFGRRGHKTSYKDFFVERVISKNDSLVTDLDDLMLDALPGNIHFMFESIQKEILLNFYVTHFETLGYSYDMITDELNISVTATLTPKDVFHSIRSAADLQPLTMRLQTKSGTPFNLLSITLECGNEFYDAYTFSSFEKYRTSAPELASKSYVLKIATSNQKK